MLYPTELRAVSLAATVLINEMRKTSHLATYRHWIMAGRKVLLSDRAKYANPAFR